MANINEIEVLTEAELLDYLGIDYADDRMVKSNVVSAIVLADAYLQKFGCDNMADIRAAIAAYKQRLRTVAR